MLNFAIRVAQDAGRLLRDRLGTTFAISLSRPSGHLGRYASSELPGTKRGSRFDSTMKTIEVNLPEPTAQRLEDAAQRLGVTAEDLLRISVEVKLGRLDFAMLPIM